MNRIPLVAVTPASDQEIDSLESSVRHDSEGQFEQVKHDSIQDAQAADPETGSEHRNGNARAQIERLTADFSQMYQERNEALRELAKAHHDVMFRLALAVDFEVEEPGDQGVGTGVPGFPHVKHDSIQDSLAPESSGLSFEVDASARMERLIAGFGQMYRERNEALKEVEAVHHDALFQLALAAEFKNGDTGVHMVRIGFLAEALALALGHGPAWAELLRKASPMHDIGKIGIPDSVLKKRSVFTPQERLLMNQHALIGVEILGQSRIPLFQLAAEVARTHHERFDGFGYPEGLAGDQIPLSGRIVSVVDFFDALSMERNYRPAMSDVTVNEMLRNESGNAFDPHIVATFLAHWPLFVALRDKVTRLQPTFDDLVRGSLSELETTA